MREYDEKDWRDTPIPVVKRRMEDEGFTVIQGDPHKILLDLDTEEAAGQYKRYLPLARRLFNVEEFDLWTSKSGFGTHVILHTPEKLDAVTRLTIQACLGSDPARELLGLMRVRNGEKEPSLLFKPRERVRR